MITNKHLFSLAVITVFTCYSHFTMAQEENIESANESRVEDTSAKDNEKNDAETIIITARKRKENLQEVPEAVTVLSGSLIENAGIDTLQGIADIAPNFHLNDSFSKATIRLSVRGIGTPQAGEAPVSFVVDGATVPDINFINQGLFEVENIQLLRGPQGSLYGQGAIAGAVIITSKTPTDEQSGYFGIQTESGNDVLLKGALSGPISDDLFYRVGFTHNDRDGQIKNVENEKLDFVNDAINFRANLKYYLSEDIEFNYTGKIVEGDYGYGIQYRIPEAELNNEESYLVAQSNYPGLERQDVTAHSLQVDWDTGFADLILISNYSSFEDIFWLEQDARPAATSIQIPYNKTEGTSHEIRMSSYDEEEFHWIIGVSYRDRTNEYRYGRVPDPGDDSRPDFPVGNPNQRDYAITDSTDLGIYFFGSYDLTEELEITAAVRYDESKRAQVYDYKQPVPIVGNREVDFSEVQPKFGLSYQINNDDLIYFSYARGYRSGGLNNPAYALQPNGYEAELTDSYEIGAKTGWYDGRILLNAAVFYMDVENYQFTEYATTIGNTNLFDVPIKGMEVELLGRPIDNLTLSVGYGYTDTVVKQFGLEPGSKDGNEVPFVPEYTFNASATHTYELGEGSSLTSFITYRKNAETYHRSDNRNSIDSQSYLDIKFTYNYENWSIAAYANNALDYRSAVHFFSTAEPVVTPNSPRSYGISLGYKF